MNNFDHVRQGRNNTYVFSIEGNRSISARRAVTLVLEYDNGKWLGIKTVGYDKIPDIRKLTTLWEKGEVNASTTGVATVNVSSEQSLQGNRTDGIASNQSVANTMSKDNLKSDSNQVKEREDEENLFRSGESAKEEYEREVRSVTVRDKYSGEVKRDRFGDKMKKNWLRMLHESYVDSMASLKALQDAIARESGSPILSFENAYWAENRMSSKNKAHMDRWHAVKK